MVTIKDVAREAGVSHPTVSLVLNGKAKQLRISDAVSERIKAAAIRLGYQRNGNSQVNGYWSEQCPRIVAARDDPGILRQDNQRCHESRFRA